MHHSPSGPSLRTRLGGAFYRLRFPRPSLRGAIAPVVLVCGLLAGLALVLPSYAPTVTGPDGALDSTDATSAGALGSGSPGRAGRSERGGGIPPEVVAAPSSTMPAPAPVPETPPAESSSPAAEQTQNADAAAPSSSPRTESSSPPAGSPSPPAGSPSPPAPSSAPDPSAPATAPVAATADASAEGQILALVNQQRTAAGCGSLTADEGLASVARAFSADMRDRGFFSHTDPDGLSASDRGDRAGVTVLAENIARGRPDPASVMSAWTESAGHRANLLNCSYTRLGVGVAYGPGGPWWTQDFA